MASTFAKVEGLEELNKQLEALPAKLRRNVLRAAAFAGAKVLAQQARALAPVGRTRMLRDSIEAKRGKNTNQTEVNAGVGFLKIRRKPKRIWHLLEFGTSKMAARPFLRPALEMASAAVTETVADYIRRRLDKVAKRGV